ncbi:sensor histidine kinase [Blastococcus deserti]|uniref:histidine kinase n=1 Tax=Blastococcus deserti TaxID=2259033 RepID=A0ABW4X7R4_9ACTN
MNVDRVGALLAGAVLALFIQWPIWDRTPALAVVNGVVTVAFVLTGALMAQYPEQRANGRLLAATGVAWSGVWLDGWDQPVLSTVALFCPAVYVVTAGTVLLRYPAARLPSARERAFVVVLCGWLLAIYLGTALTPGMESLGTLGQRPYRPPPLFPPEAAGVIRTADWLGAVLLGATFVLLLVRKARRARGLDRGELVPVLIGAVATGVSMLSYRVGKVLAESDESVTALRLVHAIVLLAVPVAFAGAALRRRLERGAVADVVAGLSGAATVEEVRDRLRRALRDSSLEVLYWVAEEESYVGTEGRPVEPPDEHDPGRLVVPVTAGDGGRLALVLADPALRRHGRLVEAAVSAAGLALENARLQAGIRAQLEQVRASRARIVEAGLAERRRLERDLHDGAQQRLLALTMQLGAVRTAVTDEDTRALVDTARAGLRQAVAELRDLARGLHPAVLSQAGLGPALESVAERLPVPVRLDVPAERYPATVETAAYFLACEAMTNAAKHADAGQVRVTVRASGGRLHVEVVDDGVGGATPSPGGGLAGLHDRVAALGGTLVVDSPQGSGTRIVASIPCA